MTDERKGRVFTQEEVNTILSRAVERQNPSAGGLTYAELIDTARQAGIDPVAIEEAVTDLQRGSETAVEDERVSAELARRKWRSLRAFSIHFTVFAMFSVLIIAIGWKNGDIFPGVVSALAWGIAISAHFTAMLFSTVLPSPDRAEAVRRELRKREEKQRRREGRENRARRRSSENEELKESAKELGVAVQRGMAVVLADVAKTIHEEVDRAKGGRGPVRGERPGVRVETKTRVGQAGEAERHDAEDDGSDDERERNERAARRPGR